MMRYSPISDDEPNMREDSARGSYYWAEDVDKEIERLRRLFRSAVVSMDSCGCEWEPDPNHPGEHTDKILALCGAHEELFAKRLSSASSEKP